MKKFIIIFVALIGMIINAKGQTLAEQLSLKVGTYQIGMFDAPDEIHPGTLIGTRIGNKRVALNMVITSCDEDGNVKGRIEYVVPCDGLDFAGFAKYLKSEQRVGFTAIKEGTSYIFKFDGCIKFFASKKSQTYDFSVFDGEYNASNSLFTADNGTMYKSLVLEKVSGTKSMYSKDRQAKFELDKKRHVACNFTPQFKPSYAIAYWVFLFPIFSKIVSRNCPLKRDLL